MWPVVAYDYDTEFTDYFYNPPVPVKMDVKITLVPLGVGTEEDVTAAAVKGLPGVISGTEITVTLPAGSQLPTAGDIVLTLSPVSYTHLDVYKRQSLMTAASGKSFSKSRMLRMSAPRQP